MLVCFKLSGFYNQINDFSSVFNFLFSPVGQIFPVDSTSARTIRKFLILFLAANLFQLRNQKLQTRYTHLFFKSIFNIVLFDIVVTQKEA